MDTKKTDRDRVEDLAVRSVKGIIANAFLTMAGMEALIGTERPHCHATGAKRSVAGVIGWVGGWSGTGILECTPEFACALSNLMLGTAVDSLNEDALDAVAEMTNIIFGAMKTDLQESLGAMGLSIPTIVYGNDVGMRNSGDAFTAIPFQIGENSLNVKLHFAHGDGKRNPLSHLCTASSLGEIEA